MTKKHKISEVWLKASILGATWAASEIILGSFLHNLRIPFNGNILTAIGFILMIAASYKWKDKGLFWRSGLICALMKTMSPSAIIFGPMIAIFMESVLLDISIRILGRNLLGFLLGASLAMTWILFQKIANFIIFYGFDIVNIYKHLMGFAAKQLNWNIDMVWSPILILLLVYLVFGVVAVYFGMKIGKNLDQKNQESALKSDVRQLDILPQPSQNFSYSLAWLFADLGLLIGMLYLINKSPLYWWIPATFFVILLWVFRYKRGLRQLSRPSFWFWFALITMLTAFAVTGMKDGSGQWLEGLIIGLKMNFRAAIVIVGFAVLGTELYNPKIRNFFAKTSFKQLPLALELAFESLPMIINRLPEVKTFFTKPGFVIRNLIQLAEQRFLDLQPQAKVIILTGGYATGKTTRLREILPYLRRENIHIQGFFAPRIMQGETTIGYDLTDVNTAEKLPFLSLNDSADLKTIGKFKANQSTIEFFTEKLIQKYEKPTLVIIDEVGRWELQENGWFKVLQYLRNQNNVIHLWVVRKDFVNPVIDKFELKNPSIIDLEKHEILESIELILNKVKQ